MKTPPTSNNPPADPAPTAIRLLLAEDHEAVRLGLCEFLGRQPGIEVVGVAIDGIEAIEQAKRLRPDVILMDISLPRVDGIEATRRIKAEWPEIHVLGLSMHQGAEVESMREAGAAATHSKDGELTALLAHVRALGGKPA